ncbi:hypothetical protein [Actinoplanes sp. NPDC051411]|uniref:hypothetical protein n=1 Tax=Actinoplanes sp. NPDC051411 TaxID=3155522 RepID=UPI003436F5A1
MAAIEETFESLTLAGLAGIGTPQRATSMIAGAVGKGFQSPNPQNIDSLLGDYLGFKPSDHWSAHLAYSKPAYRAQKLSDTSLDHRLIFSAYAWFREFKGDELSSVLARFVKIRNSFAHQDTSKTIFAKREQDLLKRLRLRRASSNDEAAFVEATSATCAVILNANAAASDDPVVHWTLHETQAINALLIYIGIVMSTCDALAVHLENSAQVQIASFDKLVLRVQEGRWCAWDRNHNFTTPNIDFELIPYRPNSRGA